MIRRDYIVGMIEQFFQALTRIKSQKSAQQWREAGASVDQEFQRLLGASAQVAAQLSETELLARTVHGEPTLAVREKILLVATLLKEAGDVFSEEGSKSDGRNCYIRGLHLLLDTLGRGEVFECPQFVPKVEEFMIALGDSELPLETHGRLMQHYERTGEFAKAEDALYSMLDLDSENAPLMELGISFYHRLENESDAHLADGNLPRAEVEAGLADLKARKEALCRAV